MTAILKYKDALDHTKFPVTSERQCGKGKAAYCIVLNCKTLEKDIDPDYKIKCKYITDMTSGPDEDDRQEVPMFGDNFDRDNEIFITFSRETPGNMALNGFRLVHPPVSSLTQHEHIDEDLFCDKKACVKELQTDGNFTWPDSCKCYHEVNKANHLSFLSY